MERFRRCSMAAAVVLAGVLAPGSALLTACSDDGQPIPTIDGASGPCGPSTCAGCCTVDGTCVQQPTASACGAGGMACVVCPPGATCQGGLCVGGGKCSAQTCPKGCCKGDTCVGGLAHTACGQNGAQCVDCTAKSQTCKAGVCSGSSSCGPGSCPNGCCQNGSCQPGNTDSACGKGGAACTDCTGLSKTCDTSSRTCTGGPPTCSPGTCSGGCCQGNSCLPGNTDSACGKGGAACADCTKQSKTCDLSTRSCTGGGPTCGPGNCSGCCQGTTCRPGTSDSECGKGGAACADCKAQGKLCDASAGTCTSAPSCGPSTCPGGCCDGTTCVTGTSSSACGSGGVPCETCAKWQWCNLSQQCDISSLADFKIKVVSASLSGSSWDPLYVGSYRNPDPFVSFQLEVGTCDGSVPLYCTPYIANTFSPSWNETLNKTYGGTYLKSPCVIVGDEDSGGSTTTQTCPTKFDLMGACSPSITSADVKKGYVYIWSCKDPTSGKNYVTNLKLEITPQ